MIYANVCSDLKSVLNCYVLAKKTRAMIIPKSVVEVRVSRLPSVTWLDLQVIDQETPLCYFACSTVTEASVLQGVSTARRQYIHSNLTELLHSHRMVKYATWNLPKTVLL